MCKIFFSLFFQGYSACIPLDDAHIIGVPSPSQLPMAQPAAHHPGKGIFKDILALIFFP